MKNRVLLIDGDIIAYRAASASETAVDWGDGLWTLHVFEEDVIRAVDQYHEKLMDELQADHAIYALTDSEKNWRLDVLPTYKSNRKGTRKPMLLPFIRQYLLDNCETFLRPRLEGDDVMGILATHPSLVKAKEKVIVSLDKDMKTVPCLYYNDRADSKIVTVTEAEADYWHLVQTLSGDPTDGYAGCPGVGTETALKILQDPRLLEPTEHTITRGKRKGEVEVRWVDAGPAPTMWDAVVCQYQKAGLGEEDALTQARVARILRAEDYNFKTKEPILWTPKLRRSSKPSNS